MRRLMIVVFALALCSRAVTSAVTAQEATPIVPDPSLCTLTPPTYEELAMYAATPAADEVPMAEGTPVMTLPAGEPLDAVTREAVEQSIIVNIACVNTGSMLMSMAAFTKEGLASRMAGQGAVFTREIYDSLLTPEPLPEDERTAIIAFGDMVMLPDGRVAAIVTGDSLGDEDPPSALVAYLAERDGHWYFDDLVQPED